MRKIICISACILLTFSLLLPVSSASSVPTPVIKATESVVRILAEYSTGYTTGSGFVIKSDINETLIATNYHVVEGTPYSISVWLNEDETVSATIIAYTDQKDMCILRLAYPVSLPSLLFSEVGARQGEAVYAVGYPGAADHLSDKEAHTSEDATITDGIVSAVREVTVSGYGTPVQILQINAAINSGNSGGPLFNANGKVVGINTYGINDSQGIFGAIEISELKSFMSDHSIPIPAEEPSFPWITIAIISLAACAIGVLVLICIRRSRKRKMKITPVVEHKDLTLSEYMAVYPDGVGANDAVSMLLPIALQLRDLHNNGNSHLQVSPNSIYVGSHGAILKDATSAEVDRYTNGYAAPEIYRGTPAGNLSDIYSFCAILSFVSSGKHPVNSLSRFDEEHDGAEENLVDDTFVEVLNVGMALNSEDRYASMQDVIIKLSPYNLKPFVSDVPFHEEDTLAPPVKKKSKKKIVLIVVICFILLLASLVGGYYGCYSTAKSDAQNGDFEEAEHLLFIPAITKLHDPALLDYINAGKLLSERKYVEANTAFEALSGYLNAEELAMEANYRHAIQLADANDFDGATDIIASLIVADYRDSTQVIHDIRFRKGIYLLQEKNDFDTAYYIFSQLHNINYDGAEEMMYQTQYLWAFDLADDEQYIQAYEKFSSIRNYSDVEDCLDALAEIIYLEGQSLYHAEKYSQAGKYFECVNPYADSEKYLTLIHVHSSFGWWVNQEDNVEKLVEIFYFEDAAEQLLATQRIAREFLCGTWKGDGYYFTMEDDGHINYDLPWFSYGDYYRIENGTVLLYKENDENSTKSLFKFTALSPDCIEIFCYKNNRSYILYRQ